LSLNRGSALRRTIYSIHAVFVHSKPRKKRENIDTIIQISRHNTGRKHVLVKPYILREGTQRLRSSELRRSLFREEQEIFHIIYASAFEEFGAFGQEDDIEQNFLHLRVLGERTGAKAQIIKPF